MKSILTLLGILLCVSTGQAAILADHTAPGQFDQISSNLDSGVDFNELWNSFDIFYGHTSHGSQIVSGLQTLHNDDPGKFPEPVMHEISSDLGHTGSLVWESQTRDWLAGHPETNMVVWSWCGGCSDNTEEGINIYLNAMNQLELDFPQVKFVYMTGHLDGTGVDGTLYRNNNQIRDYCTANGKILFDFADIESWDPDGNYYPDETDACGWCADWCAENDCLSCWSCAHSHCFNCYQKGKSFWWLLYRVAGGDTSPVRADTPGFSFELGQNYPNPFNPRTEIKLDVKQPGNGILAVYDLTGKRVATLHEGHFEAGMTYFTWDGNGSSGQRLGSGIYFCRLRIGTEMQEVKMTLLK